MLKLRRKAAIIVMFVFISMLHLNSVTALETYELEKRNPISDQFQVSIPKDFTTLPASELNKAFFIDRPESAYTNNARDINIGFALKTSPVNKTNTLESYKTGYTNYFASSSNSKLLNIDIKTINGRKFLTLEIATTHLTGNFYSVVFCTEMNNRLLFCSFNCDQSRIEELKPVANRILSSLKIHYSLVMKYVKKKISSKLWNLKLIPEVSSNSILKNASKLSQPLNSRIMYFEKTGAGLSYTNKSNELQLNFTTDGSKKFVLNDFKNIGKINRVVMSPYEKKTVKGKTVIVPKGSPVLDGKIVFGAEVYNHQGRHAAVLTVDNQEKTKADSRLTKAKTSKLALFSDNIFIQYVNLNDYKFELNYLYIYEKNEKDAKTIARTFDEKTLPFRLKAVGLTFKTTEAYTYETVYEKVK